MPKLIRAIIPMCTKCGAVLYTNGEWYSCTKCGGRFGLSWPDPYWGYYPPNVSGVVTKLRGLADRHDLESPLQSPTYTGSTLRLIADALADRLDGKDTEGNHE